MKERIENWIHILTTAFESLVGILLIIALFAAVIGLVIQISPLDLMADPERFSEFLGLASTLVIGVEFVNMLSNHSMGAVIEIMLLAIARQMIVEHSSPLENLVAVLSIGVLYLIRKYMYIPKLDRVRHRFLADLLGWKWAQEKMHEQETAREPDDGIWHPLNDAVDK